MGSWYNSRSHVRNVPPLPPLRCQGREFQFQVQFNPSFPLHCTLTDGFFTLEVPPRTPRSFTTYILSYSTFKFGPGPERCVSFGTSEIRPDRHRSSDETFRVRPPSHVYSHVSGPLPPDRSSDIVEVRPHLPRICFPHHT